MALSSKGNKSANDNASLQDVLNTHSLRVELATITALCSDAMRRDLLATFESKGPRKKLASKEIPNDSLIDPDESDGKAQQGVTESEDAEQIDLQSVRTQGLRRAAVTYFDKWQVDILRRLGEILSVRPDAVRKARADVKTRAEAAVKARRDEAYWNWANGMENVSETTADPENSDQSILPQGFQTYIPQLSKEKRVLVLDSMLLLLLSLEHYTAHSRILMLNLTRVFRLPESTLIQNESKVAEGLLTSAAAKMSADESTKRQAAEDAASRKWKVGLATVAGAALIGITGGIAAPVLAAGVGGIMGGLGLGAVASLLGPLATNMVLVGGLFGAYGGKMTGQIMEKYAQEIKDFKFVPVSSAVSEEAVLAPMGSDDETGLAELQDADRLKAHKLRVVIGISGSVAEPRDFVEPWTVFSGSRIETFGLRWEMEALTQLGRKISEVLQSFAWDFAKFQLLSMVLAGLWPFGLLRAASTLDNPFAIAKTRSDKAGKVLADALVNKVQGARPVTLVGYGLGARVIYSCLLQLAEQNAFGLVESVVFMGAPTPSEAASWRRIRAIVSGRVVNVFSADDFILGFLYRASSAQMGIAGVQEVKGIAGVENYDFTDMIKGHDKYRYLVGTILQRAGFGDLDNAIVTQQQERLKVIERNNPEPEKDASNQALAIEDEQGQIVLVDNEKKNDIMEHKQNSEKLDRASVKSKRVVRKNDVVDEGDESDHQIRMEDNEEPMSVLEPEPEPDYGADRETVTFGAGARGFNVEWDYGGK